MHKISIIPRGVGALGYTIQRPTEDRFLMTRAELENKMTVLLGGRAAEHIVFQHLSTGAADDLQKVTDIARSMIMRYGMDPTLGHVAYEADVDLGQVISCNCSICRKRGALLAFVPEGSFRLKSGGEALTDYLFNKKVVHHMFCPTCGVGAFARGEMPDGTKIVALNVRCLDGVDLDTLKVQKVDGASL